MQGLDAARHREFALTPNCPFALAIARARLRKLPGPLMTREDFNTFCAGLVATNHVVQWGNADVWKVGPKVFALCGWNDGKDAFTFKATDMAFMVLQDEPGIRPAPYLASRGMKWLQVYEEKGMSDADLREHILVSYDLVAAGMTKKMRADLGITVRS